uniref:Uncharacterized protein n=1 Tax=Hyaloperonospora arabidopsidis (strain Emoy2) TaxID=559515 RepID=M4C4U6_HYAAE
MSVVRIIDSPTSFVAVLSNTLDARARVINTIDLVVFSISFNVTCYVTGHRVGACFVTSRTRYAEEEEKSAF